MNTKDLIATIAVILAVVGSILGITAGIVKGNSDADQKRLQQFELCLDHGGQQISEGVRICVWGEELEG